MINQMELGRTIVIRTVDGDVYEGEVLSKSNDLIGNGMWRGYVEILHELECLHEENVFINLEKIVSFHIIGDKEND